MTLLKNWNHRLKSNANKYYYVIILTLLSVIMWSVSIIQAKNVPIGDYGLVSALPITYYIGFFMLLLAIYFNIYLCNCQTGLFRFIIVIQLFLVAAFIFFTPALVEGTARGTHSWIKWGYADYIIRNQHINSSQIFYHYWPLPFIFSAELYLVIGIEAKYMLLIIPLLLDVMIFSLIIAFFFRFFDDVKKSALGILLFYLIVWVDQFHYAPQIFAFFLLLLLIYLVHFYLLNFQIKYIAIIGLVFFSIMMTHLLTAVVASAYIGLMLVIYMIRKIRDNSRNADSPRSWSFRKLRLPLLLFTFAAIMLIWYLFAENWVNYSNWKFDPWLIVTLIEEYVGKMSLGADAHRTVVMIRVLFSIIAALIVLLGAYLAYNKEYRKAMFLLLFSGIIPVFLFEYGAEIAQRAFLFCSLPMAALMGLGTDKKRYLTLLLAFSIVAVPLHMLSMYGNENMDYTPATYITGGRFFFDHASEGNIMGVSVEFSEYIENHREVSTQTLVDNTRLENNTYILYTTVLENHLIWYYGDYEYLDSLNTAITNGKYLKIYSSPDSELYKLS